MVSEGGSLKFLIEGAIKSKDEPSMFLWARHLNKFIQRDRCTLSKQNIIKLMQSKELGDDQKSFMFKALQKNSKEWEYVVGLSEKANYFPFYSKILNKLQNVSKETQEEVNKHPRI